MSYSQLALFDGEAVARFVPPVRIVAPKAEVSAARHVQSQPEPVLVQSDPWRGWTTEATYLAHLYLSMDTDALARIYAQPDPGCTPISAADLTTLFQARLASPMESDLESYEPGLDGSTLLIDYWASGRVRWAEIAKVFTKEKLQRLGAIPLDLELLEVLGRGKALANTVQLELECTSRDQKLQLDKVFSSFHAHWNRVRNSYVFSGDATRLFSDLLQTGFTKVPSGFDERATPATLVKTMIGMAKLEPGLLTLDVGAGTGALALAAAQEVEAEHCFGVEICAMRAQRLQEQGIVTFHGDFLSRRNWGQSALRFDRVLMHPPSLNQRDIDHVMHAWPLLARTGRLVALMSASVQYRVDAKSVAFREFVASVKGVMLPCLADAALESGPPNCLVVLDKPDRVESPYSWIM